MTAYPRPPRRCSLCREPILWWRNARRDEGMLPVDPSSDPDKGTIRKSVIERGGETVVAGSVLSGDELVAAVADAEMLFTHHANTCVARKPPNPKPAGLEIDLPGGRRRRVRRVGTPHQEKK